MDFDKEKLKNAKKIISQKISIPIYFKDFIDNKINIETKTLIPCPLHDETNPSFKYFRETDTFYCFGCEKGGDVVDLHYFYNKKYNDNYTIYKAVKDLSKEYGIIIPRIDFYKHKVDKNNINFNRTSKNKKVTEGNYPTKWLKREIEKILYRIKNKDIDTYIKYINELDEAIIIEDNINNKLELLFKELKDI